MRTVTHSGFGETKEFAIAQAMSGVFDNLDDGVRPVIVLDGVEVEAGGYRAHVHIMFMRISDGRQARHELSEKEALELKKRLHDKDLEDKRRALEKVHDRIEREWNQAHILATHLDPEEHIPSMEAYTVILPLEAAYTYEAFDKATHERVPEYNRMHMTLMPFDTLEYSVWGPTIEWVPELLTADNDNVIRHKLAKEYKPADLMPIHKMHGSVYTLEFAA